MEEKFSREMDHWCYQHDTKEPLIRYFRDRRLHYAMRILRCQIGDDLSALSTLVVCGGSGGEATFLANQGIANITNSDFSTTALATCEKRELRVRCLELDAEAMDIPDDSFDLVVVKDGLHHLSRPVLGYNEMIRVARRAVVVMEPAAGWAASCLGRTWEWNGNVVNYVFRWDSRLFEQALRSQILQSDCRLIIRRMWDHHVAVNSFVSRLTRSDRGKLLLARAIYGLLRPLNFMGNQMIAIVMKQPTTATIT
jgi:hypothetical protein